MGTEGNSIQQEEATNTLRKNKIYLKRAKTIQPVLYRGKFQNILIYFTTTTGGGAVAAFTMFYLI